MRSWKKPSFLSLSPSAMCALLSGCLAGENQTFFDYASESGTGGIGEILPGGSAGEVDPTPTPSYGLCCNVESGHTVPASATGCDHGAALYEVNSEEECMLAANPTPTPPMVCDPFQNGNTGAATAQNGIKAKLYYYTDQIRSEHPYQSVNDFFTWGVSPNVDFFFTNIFTPTRAFDSGFMMSDGTLVTNTNGDPLYEHFAFKMTGGIQLPQGLADRNVQFAVLSDDGTIMRVTGADGSSNTVINNDGNHPTKMACASAPITVTANSKLKFELDYYQGPRYHIALTLLWREWTPDGAFDPNDPWCGQSGNSLYFDSSTSPSTPNAPWNDLMTRWEVVPSNVFYVDGENGSNEINPCH